MKVNYENEMNKVEICRLAVGETFIANRTTSHERALYMKIDGNSGAIACKNHLQVFAVNLESGQVRVFRDSACVERKNAEVNICKKS